MGGEKSSPVSLTKTMAEPDLILNPYLKLKFFKNQNENDCVSFSSPTPKVGVQILQFEQGEKPRLYELFDELRQTSLNFLDIAEDLSEAERNLLTENGVLVEPAAVSQPPLFSCFLDEVVLDQEQSFAEQKLIVNPSFYYEEALDYETIMRRRKYGFEPLSPVAWVTSVRTGITLGYWLRHDFLEIIKDFEAAAKPAVALSQSQIAVLRQVEILVAPNSQTNEIEDLSRSAAQFQKEKYAALRAMLPPAQLAAIRRYFEQLLAQGFMLSSDRQVALRHAIHNDAVSIYFHEQLAPFVSRLAGQTLKPSYVYSAIYVEDAVLEAHVDRPQCEFTMSMQIDYEPAQQSATPWALCLDDLRGERVETFLANGDALVYKGCELVHYREALFKNHRSTSIFFHFVGLDFAGQLD